MNWSDSKQEFMHLRVNVAETLTTDKLFDEVPFLFFSARNANALHMS